jgi:hypothetical protein
MLLLVMVLPRNASALCIEFPFKELVSNRKLGVSMIFHGTVQHIDGQMIEFAVDRVWKGPVRKRVVTFNRDQGKSGGTIYEASSTCSAHEATLEGATRRFADGDRGLAPR